MRLIVARLLDRGWGAQWVLSRPLYQLTGMLQAVANDEREQAARNARPQGDGQTKTYVVSKEAREARKQAQLQKNKDV